MATKYVTLKDSNGDTLYPQAVATNLAPGSITSSEIDWSSFIPVVTGTYSTAWKFPDGKMICFGRRQITRDINGSYEGSYFNSLSDYFENIFAEAFVSAPIVTVTITQNSSLLGFNFTSITTTGFSGYVWKTQSKSSVTLTVNFTAVGMWK